MCICVTLAGWIISDTSWDLRFMLLYVCVPKDGGIESKATGMLIMKSRHRSSRFVDMLSQTNSYEQLKTIMNNYKQLWNKQLWKADIEVADLLTCSPKQMDGWLACWRHNRKDLTRKNCTKWLKHQIVKYSVIAI